MNPLICRTAEELKCPSKKHSIDKKYYSKTTQLASLHCALDGDFDGPTKSWHPNTQLKSVGSYQDGEMHGKWTRWHSNGAMLDQGIWDEGTPHEKWYQWHPDKTIHKEGHFIYGEKYGLWVIRDITGKSRNIDFGNNKSDYYISINPLSEMLSYSTDWSDAKAKYTTKNAMDLDFTWQYNFNHKWASIVKLGMRQREFQYEGMYNFESEEDSKFKFALGASFSTNYQIFRLMVESYPDFYIRHGSNFDPQNSSLKVFSHRNLAISAYFDQFIYKGHKYHWIIGAGFSYLLDRSKEADEISNNDFSQPKSGFGTNLKIEAIYNSSTKRSYFVTLQGSYKKQGIKRVDTNMEFSTNRINAGITAGLRHNFGKKNINDTKDRKNWVGISFVPVSEIVDYEQEWNGSSASYATTSAQDLIVSWNRIFSKKWSGALSLEIKGRTYGNDNDQSLFEKDSSSATSFIISLKRKGWGFHLAAKNQIFMRFHMNNGTITPDTTLIPAAFITYNHQIFSWKKIQFEAFAKALLLGPNIFKSDEWKDEDDDGYNDNIIDAGIGFGGRIGIQTKYNLSARKYIQGIAFFDKEFQSVTMEDSQVKFDISKTQIGLGIKLGHLF